MSLTRRPPVVSQGSRPVPARPELWVEGHQRPRFDLKAFARVSVALSRETVGPALSVMAGMFRHAAGQMAQNRIGPRLATTGRLGRALPRKERLAGGLTGIACLTNAAAEIAVPPEPLPVPPAYPDLLRPPSVPRRTVARLPDTALPPPPALVAVSVHEPAAAPPVDSPTLAAIRAMIAEMRDPDPVVPRHISTLPQPRSTLLTHEIPLSPPEPADPTPAQWLRAQTFHFAAALLGWGATILAVPIGATRAALAYFDGQDLRDWP